LAKKRKKTKKIKNNFIKYINIIIAFVIIFSIGFTIYNFLSKIEQSSKPKTHIKKRKKIKKYEPKFEELTKSLEVEYIDEDEEAEKAILESLKEVKNKPIISKKDVDEIEKIAPSMSKKLKIHKKRQKPKLIIIIDDISNVNQVKAIKSIGYPITMSFFPPEVGRIHSNEAAKNIKNYMVHLPCEANSRAFDEPKTLHTTDPYYVYDERIAEIRELFPRARFINNHTGSKLTADRKSMDRLMKALKKYDFAFIDSLTTSKSVARIYAKKYGVKYFRRNVFIDNKQDVDYILNKIKRAIAIAKKRGIAIAIGHPHKETFIALKKAKRYFKNIKLIYINDLL